MAMVWCAVCVKTFFYRPTSSSKRRTTPNYCVVLLLYIACYHRVSKLLSNHSPACMEFWGDKIYLDTGSAQAGGPSRPWPTQCLYLYLTRNRNASWNGLNVHGPGRLIVGRSGDATSHDHWYRITSVLYLYVRTYLLFA